MAATYKALSAERKCQVSGCGQRNHAKGYCSRHYTTFRRYGDANYLVKARVIPNPICTVSGCERLHCAKGFCSAHYQRFRKTGSTGSSAIAGVRLSCSIEGCARPRHAHGLCGTHYLRLRQHGEAGGPELKVEPSPKDCQVLGCRRPPKAKGYCATHYSRLRLRGDVGAQRPVQSYDAREWLAAHKNYASDNCLIWNCGGRKTQVVSIAVVGAYEGKEREQEKIGVGRAMCIIAHGDPPTDKHVAAHWCGNGHLGCVNPRHLRWATQQENMADKILHGVRTQLGEPYANEAQVKAIRTLARTMSAEDIAAAFRVGVKAVERVIADKHEPALAGQ